MAPRHHIISPEGIYANALDGFGTSQHGSQDLGDGAHAAFPAPPLSGGYATDAALAPGSDLEAAAPGPGHHADPDGSAPDVAQFAPELDSFHGHSLGNSDPHFASDASLEAAPEADGPTFADFEGAPRAPNGEAFSHGAADLADIQDFTAPGDPALAAAETAAPSAASSGSFFVYAGAFIAAVALGAGTFFFVGGGQESPETAASGKPPVLRADPRPAKVLPKDPGGRQFANQNRAVQNRGTAGQQSGTKRGTPAVKRVRTVRVNPQGGVRVPSNTAKRVAQAPAAGRAVAPQVVFRDGGVSIADALNAGALADGSTAKKARNAAARATTGIGEILEPAARQVAGTNKTSGGSQSTADIAAALTSGTRSKNAQARLPRVPASVAQAEKRAQATARKVAQKAARAAAKEQARRARAATGANDAGGWSGTTTTAAQGASGWDTAVETSTSGQATRTARIASPSPQVISQGVSSLEPGNFVVQIASRKERASAQASFQSVKRRFPQLLSDKAASIQEVDLGAKGTWYRVRIAPASSKRQAAELCSNLKAAGLSGCLVRTFGS